MGPFLRLGVWGASAIIAVGVAVLAGRSEVGAARASAALAALRTSPMDLLDPGAARASKAEAEVKDLADAIRTLSDDNDQLAARVATVERNLSDLTGSIAREHAPTGANSPGSGEPAAASPPTPITEGGSASAVPPPPSVDSAAANEDAQTPEPIIGTIVTQPQPRSGPLSTIESYVSAASASQPATRLAAARADNAAADIAPRGIAIELAIATNVNALRARWGTLKTQHPALLDGLKPLVSVRPSTRPGFTEFHLVAGPVGSHDVAARLCGALSAAHVPCRPAPYDGQSLELR